MKKESINYQELVKSSLLKKSYIRFYVDIARFLDISNDGVILLQFLMARDDYYDTGGDWFAITSNKREKFTNLSEYKQRGIIKKLESKGVLTTKKLGLPASTFFKINYKKFYFLYSAFLGTPVLEHTATGDTGPKLRRRR